VRIDLPFSTSIRGIHSSLARAATASVSGIQSLKAALFDIRALVKPAASLGSDNAKIRNSGVSVRRSSWFRGDINGLRVLAIVPVVAFHAGVPGFNGGFVGVDVFFVISGFLITTNLLREVESTGRINIGKFWAKRVRRLVPASVLMLLVSLPVALWLLSPLQWAALGKSAGASLLYVSNFVFARQSTDYFAADLGVVSPFLHTWSLGVEEQFYLLWPLLMIAAFLIARRRGVPIRRTLLFVFLAAISFSFILALVWTQTAPTAAFYLLPARAWEFAGAGLLALLPIKLLGSRFARSSMAVIGILVLVGTVVLLPPTTPFPGFAALLPVAATMLIILGGRRDLTELPPWPARFLAVAPMQWIGALSYSWYLWHWPFIVLAGVAFQSHSVGIAAAAAVASLAAAWATYHLVENPVRFSPALVGSLRRTFLSAAAVTVIGLLVAGGSYLQGKRVVSENALIEQARAQIPNQECDRETTVIQGANLCEMGDLDSSTTVVLIGDSHAGHWNDALGEAAKQEGIHLVVRWMSNCPAIDVDVLSSTGTWIWKCAPFREATMAIVKELEPDAIVISQAEAYNDRIVDANGESLELPDQLELWRTSYDSTLTALASLSPRTGIIQDNPRISYDPNECLVRTGATAESCASPRADSLEGISVLKAESASAISGHEIASYFTTVDTLCSDVCKVIDDGIPVYRDGGHLSRQWTLTQVVGLREFLDSLVTQ
jgi:peptidoglycan/LPS O-acetylase OafA/YrhL